VLYIAVMLSTRAAGSSQTVSYLEPTWSSTIAFIVICGVVVGTRFLNKFVNKLRVGADDWWVLLGYAFFLVEEGLQLKALQVAMSHKGLPVSGFRRPLYISAMFYAPTNTCLRIGILFYYRRIFAIPRFYRLAMILIICCVIWFIPAFLVEIFTCYPLATDWDPNVHGKCLHYTLFWIIIMPFEVALDTAILALPVREVINLQMPIRRKILVSLIFLLGGFVIITGIVRVVETYTRSPGALDQGVDMFWYNIHIGTAFICACAPTYTPLVSKFIEVGSSFWSSIVSQSRTKTSSNSSHPSENFDLAKVNPEQKRSYYKQIDEQRSDRNVLVEAPDNTHS